MAKKRIANSSVPVLTAFKNWCIRNGITSATNYCTWLKNTINDIQNWAPSVQLTMSEKYYLDVVPALIQSGIFYKAEIVCELLEKHIKEAIKVNSCSSLRNDQSALKAYIRYIKSIIKEGGFSTALSVPVPDYDELMPFRKELNHYPTNVAKGKFDKIDGIDALIELFGNDHAVFIKKVLKESYFFSPILEVERFDELKKELGDTSYARYSQEEYEEPGKTKKSIISESQITYISHTLKDGSGPFKVVLDNDGNRKLRQIINDKTNYWVSNGKDTSQFVNFRISHIWGRAFDPRYFTSLWNVVLVPAWANDLLEKEYGYSSLVDEMKDTFKAICINLYGMKYRNWGDIMLQSMPDQSQCRKAIPNDYQINVIQGRGSVASYGIIYSRIVTV